MTVQFSALRIRYGKYVPDDVLSQNALLSDMENYIIPNFTL